MRIDLQTNTPGAERTDTGDVLAIDLAGAGDNVVIYGEADHATIAIVDGSDYLTLTCNRVTAAAIFGRLGDHLRGHPPTADDDHRHHDPQYRAVVDVAVAVDRHFPAANRSADQCAVA